MPLRGVGQRHTSPRLELTLQNPSAVYSSQPLAAIGISEPRTTKPRSFQEGTSTNTRFFAPCPAGALVRAGVTGFLTVRPRQSGGSPHTGPMCDKHRRQLWQASRQHRESLLRRCRADRSRYPSHRFCDCHACMDWIELEWSGLDGSQVRLECIPELRSQILETTASWLRSILLASTCHYSCH